MSATRRDRKLPAKNWTPLDQAQNFATAATIQARSLALEAAERGEHDGDQSAVKAVETQDAAFEILAVEHVAKTITGVSQIGQARRLLELAGFTTKITGQRITVNTEIEAQLTSTGGQSWWQVYAIDGTPPVWTAGTQCPTAPSTWVGAD
jgi:hypothetical protein